MSQPTLPEIRIEYWNEDSRCIQVMLDGRSRAEVRQRRTRYGMEGPHPAEVSWPAIGSVPKAYASRFAECIQLAVAIGEAIENMTWSNEKPAMEDLI